MVSCTMDSRISFAVTFLIYKISRWIIFHCYEVIGDLFIRSVKDLLCEDTMSGVLNVTPTWYCPVVAGGGRGLRHMMASTLDTAQNLLVNGVSTEHSRHTGYILSLTHPITYSYTLSLGMNVYLLSPLKYRLILKSQN